MGRVPVNRRPVTIRGVTYASRAEAGLALGVAAATIGQAERLGYLQTVGLKRTMGVEAGGRMPHPVTIRGVTYPSQTAAAKALGVSTSRISNAKREGTLDLVGLRKAAGEAARGYRRDEKGRMRRAHSKEG